MTNLSPLPPRGTESLSISLFEWKLPFVHRILRVRLLISFNSSIVQSVILKVWVMILITNILCGAALLYGESSEEHTFLHLAYSSFRTHSLFTSPTYAIFSLWPKVEGGMIFKISYGLTQVAHIITLTLLGHDMTLWCLVNIITLSKLRRVSDR